MILFLEHIWTTLDDYFFIKPADDKIGKFSADFENIPICVDASDENLLVQLDNVNLCSVFLFGHTYCP